MARVRNKRDDIKIAISILLAGNRSRVAHTLQKMTPKLFAKHWMSYAGHVCDVHFTYTSFRGQKKRLTE